MRPELVEFDAVEALARDVRGLLCRIAGRHIWVPSDRILIDDRVVQRPGDRGRLVLTRTVAVGLGLARPS